MQDPKTLVRQLRKPKEWCCIFEMGGHMRHGTSELPTQAASIIEAQAKEIERLTGIADAAREFCERGTKVTQLGGQFVQKVIEHKDKSDPHYKLCVALEGYSPALTNTQLQRDAIAQKDGA